MTITATTTQVTGPAGAAGTVIGTQALAAPADWTKLTTLGTLPTGGAKLKVTSDAEAFRVSVVDPEQSSNDAGADRPPRGNGILVPWFGTDSRGYEIEIPRNAQVWVKQA